MKKIEKISFLRSRRPVGFKVACSTLAVAALLAAGAAQNAEQGAPPAHFGEHALDVAAAGAGHFRGGPGHQLRRRRAARRL